MNDSTWPFLYLYSTWYTYLAGCINNICNIRTMKLSAKPSTLSSFLLSYSLFIYFFFATHQLWLHLQTFWTFQHHTSFFVTPKALERDTMHFCPSCCSKTQLCSIGSHHIVICWEMKKADRFAKSSTRQPQQRYLVPYSEARTIIRHRYKKFWTDQHNPQSNNQILQLSCQEQATTLRLCTQSDEEVLKEA